MFKRIKDAWNWTKAKFNYAHSILLARATALTGFLIAALSGADWGPIIGAATGAGFTKAQAVSLGIVFFVQGVLAEMARRQGTVTLADGQLIPANVSEKKEAIKIIKETK